MSRKARTPDRMKRVAEVVARGLAAAGWTRQRLADEAGLSPSTVTRILAGEILPEPDTLRAIADALPTVTYKDLMEAAGHLEGIPVASAALMRRIQELQRELAALEAALLGPQSGRIGRAAVERSADGSGDSATAPHKLYSRAQRQAIVATL